MMFSMSRTSNIRQFGEKNTSLGYTPDHTAAMGGNTKSKE